MGSRPSHNAVVRQVQVVHASALRVHSLRPLLCGAVSGLLGDQFTSHSQTVADLIHIVLNLATRSFVGFRDVFVVLKPAALMAIRKVSLLLPQAIRMIQNLRRYHDTK